ncbi:hypothetical protein DFH09DRAFT_1503973 [Mycena vulgaris]|nr:hypothetical protein DFH09DRAFT_1503973 [Mycena vulgaris]
MKFSAPGLLSFVVAAMAATIPQDTFPPGHVNIVIDAASYMAGGNGTVVSRDTVVKRNPGDVYLCTAAFWSGYCVLITGAFSGGCVNLASDLDNLVSSFGPDAGQDCYMYDAHDCNILLGSSIGPIRSPGGADMSQTINTGSEGGARPFNDVLSSYRCNFT